MSIPTMKPAMTDNGTIYGWDWVDVSAGDAEIEEAYKKLHDGTATDEDLTFLVNATWVGRVPDLGDPRVKSLRDEIRRRGPMG
jgi:hypothetical protein